VSTRDNEMIGTMLKDMPRFLFIYLSSKHWGVLRDDDNAQKHVKDIVIYF
jgi:hypothetical protein